jgi:hypothetical protein
LELRFPVVAIIVALCAILILLSKSLTATNSARSNGWKAQCVNNLRNLALALQEYETKKGHFPPPYTTDANGKPLHSWRTLILPYLEQAPIFGAIHLDEPWDSPTNRRVTQIKLDIFRCPEDTAAAPNETSYVAVVGSDTVWNTTKPVGLNDIKDGLATTILLVEMKHSGIAWAEPRDLDLDHLPPGYDKKKLLELLSNHPGYVNVAFANGSVVSLPVNLSPAEFDAMLTKSGGEPVDETKW